MHKNNLYFSKSAVMKARYIFLILVIIRLISVFLVQTAFVPDEYWQSLEVAHFIIFGYGYLTWEWKFGIRSYIYPIIFSGFYKILQLCGLDSADAVIYGPRIIHAFLSTYSDFCFYRWAESRAWALLTIISSWFWFYTASRTLINSFECSLTIIAVSKFPWLHKRNDDSNIFLWIVAALCCIRPTAAVVWAPLCFYHLGMAKEPVSIILKRYLPIGVVVFALSTLIDSLAYGSFLMTPYEFLRHNIINDVGSWYGSQPWYWYMTSALPALLGIQFIPFILATLVVIKNRKAHPNELAMLATITAVIAVYSSLPHKEIRFLLPILPLMLYISSRFLAAWSVKAKRSQVFLVIGVIILGNAFPAYYFSYVHQRGTVDVMSPLRKIAARSPSESNFLFLMPCHSTPLYSHLHVNVSVKFLTCEPNFKNKVLYVDESDRFYENPSKWLQEKYHSNISLPTHIITFDNLVPHVSDFLEKYKTVHHFFHTNFPTSRIGQYVLIHERMDLVKHEEDL